MMFHQHRKVLWDFSAYISHGNFIINAGNITFPISIIPKEMVKDLRQHPSSNLFDNDKVVEKEFKPLLKKNGVKHMNLIDF